MLHPGWVTLYEVWPGNGSGLFTGPPTHSAAVIIVLLSGVCRRRLSSTL